MRGDIRHTDLFRKVIVYIAQRFVYRRIGRTVCYLLTARIIVILMYEIVKHTEVELLALTYRAVLQPVKRLDSR